MYKNKKEPKKRMTNYSNGKIYKIINSVDRKIYIGSTTVSLSTRLAKHKNDAKRRPRPVHRHLNTIGWDTVRIVLLENVTCFNKEQLIQREQHYIDLLKPSLNKQSAYVHCTHGREHNRCKECGGVSLCIHNVRKGYCKICSPVYCPSCDITTSKSEYKQHIKTIKHIYNFIHS